MATLEHLVTAIPTAIPGSAQGSPVGLQPEDLMLTSDAITQPDLSLATRTSRFRLKKDQFYRAEPKTGESTWVWHSEGRADFYVDYEAVA